MSFFTLPCYAHFLLQFCHCPLSLYFPSSIWLSNSISLKSTSFSAVKTSQESCWAKKRCVVFSHQSHVDEQRRKGRERKEASSGPLPSVRLRGSPYSSSARNNSQEVLEEGSQSGDWRTTGDLFSFGTRACNAFNIRRLVGIFSSFLRVFFNQFII